MRATCAAVERLQSSAAARVMMRTIAITRAILVGSLLCGMAWSIPSLIGFRLMQGVGAGAIQPVCMTVVGDLYPVRERGKVHGCRTL